MADPLVEVAALLGHVATIRETRARSYFVECSCGYVNSQRRRRVPNVDAAAREARRYVTWHLEKAVREARLAGRIRVTAGGHIAVEGADGETHLVDA